MGNGILVYCETDGGKPRKTAYELLSKARALGVGPVSAVVLGEADVSSLGAYGATTVYHYNNPLLAKHSTVAPAMAVSECVSVTVSVAV